MGKVHEDLGMVKHEEERMYHHKNKGKTGGVQDGFHMVEYQEEEKDGESSSSDKEKDNEIGVEKEVPRVLLAVAATLERLVSRNEKCLKDLSSHRKLTIYHGLRPPNISIRRYLERINKYSSCSQSCFVVGFIYIDHLVHKQPNVPVISLNVHRLLITSIMVATKLLDDVHYNNSFYARVGGISNAELNNLELALLFHLDFRLQVTGHMFEGYCTHLEREMILAEQRIERSLPKNVEDSENENHEKQRQVIDARRRVQPSMSPGSALLDP